MWKVFSILFLLIYFQSAKSQCNFGLVAGAGSHEAIHAGLKFSINPKNSFIFSYGNFLNVIPNEKYWNVSMEYERILRSRKDTLKLSNWSFCPKLFYWRLNDSYYYFKVFSLELAMGYSWKLGDKHGLKFDFGPVFMIVEDYHRLTFREAGWPKKFMFSGSVKYYILIR